jgi:S-adenosylmethionine synthetase
MSEDKVSVAGSIEARELPDIPRIVSATVRDAGYTALYEIDITLDGPDERVSPLSAPVRGEAKNCSGNECIGRCTSLSCGDIPANETTTITGCATAETSDLQPLAAVLAHRVVTCYALVRNLKAIPGLLPGAAVSVSVEYVDGEAVRLAGAELQIRCAEDTARDVLCRNARLLILDPSLTALPVTGDTKVETRVETAIASDRLPAGRSGRPIRFDSLSPENCSPAGKDGRYLSRSAPLMTRYVSKNIVAAGLADRCAVSAAYTAGSAKAEVSVDTHGTGEYDDGLLAQAVNRLFDFRIAAMIPVLRLNKPGFADYSGYGVFMKHGALWEHTDAMGELRQLCYQLEMEDEEY